jgi:hypothetical protein
MLTAEATGTWAALEQQRYSGWGIVGKKVTKVNKENEIDTEQITSCY